MFEFTYNQQERERVERGIRLAATFGIMPATMKLCGRKFKNAPEVLRNFLDKKSDATPQKAREALETFESATQYYKLIAGANGIADHFDERIIEAYWIGNDLLKNVNPDDIKKMIREKMTGAGLMTREDAEQRIANLTAQPIAHHNFHVLNLGGATEEARQTKNLQELCRVSWGTVKENPNDKIQNPKVVVDFQPLEEKNGRISLSAEQQQKKIQWDKALVPEIKKGDIVAFHWNQICQILTPEQTRNLEHYTNLSC